MNTDFHFQFFEKVHHYPIVNSSILGLLGIYKRLKAKSKVLDLTLSKAEVVLSTIKTSTETIGNKLTLVKCVDEALCYQLERFEKMCPFILEETTKLLEIPGKLYSIKVQPTVETLFRPVAYSVTTVSNTCTVVVSSMSSLVEASVKNVIPKANMRLDLHNVVYDIVENLFNRFLPDNDDIQSVSSSFVYKRFRIKSLSKKTYHRLTKITTNNIDNFYKSNLELVEKLQATISEILQIDHSSSDLSSVAHLLEMVLQYSKQLQNSMSTFKLAPVDKHVADIIISLEFIGKNISKLQIIISEAKLEFIKDKFTFQTNFVVDQIRPGLDSLTFHLRNYLDNVSQLDNSTDAITTNSYFSMDNDELSECTLCESDSN